MEQIKGVYGLYYVDNDGNVYNGRGRKLKGRPDTHGYLQVRLPIRVGVYRNMFVHILVARAYMGDKPEGFDVDHINFVRIDNRIDNLRYLSMHINRGRRRNTILGKEECITVG